MKDSDFLQLNIVFREYDKVWSYCVFHKDIVRPNLSISLLDKYYGRYTCWACGKTGQLTKQQMMELNLDSFTIYKSNGKNLDTRWNQFSKSCYNNLQKFPLLKLGLAKQLNISTKSLDDWLIGFDSTSFTIPMFREDLSEYFREGGFCGVQRRFPDGTKRCVTRSRLGLMYSYKDIISSDYIFICEGFSDGISVWDLGLNSMARPHCRHTDGIAEFLEDVLDYSDTVIIIPDDDIVGKKGARELQDMLCCDYDCKVYPSGEAKDVRELIRLKGKDYVRRELESFI